MELKIKSLHLQNFKGVRDQRLDFPRQNHTIFGRNASGKSTFYDAFLWLLFDKDSHGRADFEIKTVGVDGVAMPQLDHLVVCEVESGGREFRLKKTYREVYTKKRGSATATFTGHETLYEIDGVPKTKTEYQGFIKNLCPEQLFRLLTSPAYFNESMHWTDRRGELMAACGDVSAGDIISANPQMEPLRELFAKRTPTDAKKVLMAERKKINDELAGIPSRIDEATKAIPEVVRNPQALMVEAQAIAKQLSSLRDKKASANTSSATIELQNKIAAAEGELIQIKNRYLQEAPDLTAEQREVADISSNITTATNRVREIEAEIKYLNGCIEIEKKRNADIVARWKEVNAQRYNGGSDCPTCGQPLPESKVAAATAAFNESRAEEIKALNTQGAETVERVNGYKSKVETLAAELELITTALPGRQADLEAAKAALEAKKQRKPVEQLPEYIGKQQEIEGLRKELDDVRQGTASASQSIDQEITAAEAKFNEVNRAITALDTATVQEQRIEELKKREAELAQQFADTEKTLTLIEEFIRAKVGMLTDKINSFFELVSFRLFEDQVNGGLAEVCTCTMNGVPYSDLNTAGKIQAGLDIIRTLSGHHDFFPPIWIDGRESVTEIPEMNCQTISLVVSPEHESLEIA